MTAVEQRCLAGCIMALKFPRRRVRNAQTQNIQDMNDVLFPVVEEMGRLNEHNFNESIQSELTITDMSRDVSFNTANNHHTKDVSDLGAQGPIDNGWTTGTLFRIPQNNQWVAVWPDRITKEIISKDGGMFRIVAGGQWGSERIAVDRVSSYLLFALRIDGAIIPDSIIGDQDYHESNDRMERGLSGQFGSFLVDFIISLEPGIHTIEVVVNNQFLKEEPRRTPTSTSPQIDAYVANSELLVWEMHR